MRTQCCSIATDFFLVAMLSAVMVGTAAAQSADLSVTAEFEIPISVTCNTAINAGNVDILSGDFLSNASSSARSWGMVPGSGGASGELINTSAIAVADAQSGSCKVSGVSPDSQVTISIGSADLTSVDSDAVLIASPSVKEADNSNNSVTTHTIPSAGDPDPVGPTDLGSTATGTMVYDESEQTLTFLVGLMAVEFPQDSTPAGLIGTYTGSATVEISL